MWYVWLTTFWNATFWYIELYIMRCFHTTWNMSLIPWQTKQKQPTCNLGINWMSKTFFFFYIFGWRRGMKWKDSSSDVESRVGKVCVDISVNSCQSQIEQPTWNVLSSPFFSAFFITSLCTQRVMRPIPSCSVQVLWLTGHLPCHLLLNLHVVPLLWWKGLYFPMNRSQKCSLKSS